MLRHAENRLWLGAARVAVGFRTELVITLPMLPFLSLPNAFQRLLYYHLSRIVSLLLQP